MSDEELRKALDEYRKREGRAKTIGALTMSGLSPRFAEQAADGQWDTKRIKRPTRDKVLKALSLKAS